MHFQWGEEWSNETLCEFEKKITGKVMNEDYPLPDMMKIFQNLESLIL